MAINPKLKLYDQIDGTEIQVWIVDGILVRNHIDIDFTNGGHHYSELYVPINEVWIDREAPGADEQKFWALRQLVERRLCQKGYTPQEADARAKRIEEHERKFGLGTKNPKLKLVEAAKDKKIWLVSGKIVRDTYDVDFSLGGHGYVYHYIPYNEIWLDDALKESEYTPIKKHELFESELMKNGMPYDLAHSRANILEQTYRSLMK